MKSKYLFFITFIVIIYFCSFSSAGDNVIDPLFPVSIKDFTVYNSKWTRIMRITDTIKEIELNPGTFMKTEEQGFIHYYYADAEIVAHPQSKKIVKIELTSSFVQTCRGIKIGDSIKSVLQKYDSMESCLINDRFVIFILQTFAGDKIVSYQLQFIHENGVINRIVYIVMLF